MKGLLCGIFPVLEGPPALLHPLDDLLGQALLLQLPIEVLDVHGGELFVGDGIAKDRPKLLLVIVHPWLKGSVIITVSLAK